MNVTATITTGTDTVAFGSPRVATYNLELKHENGQVFTANLAPDETAFVFLDVPEGDFTVTAAALSLAGDVLGDVQVDTGTVSAEDATADITVATLDAGVVS